MDLWKSKSSVAVACFLPGRAKDLSAPPYQADGTIIRWPNASQRKSVIKTTTRSTNNIRLEVLAAVKLKTRDICSISMYRSVNISPTFQSIVTSTSSRPRSLHFLSFYPDSMTIVTSLYVHLLPLVAPLLKKVCWMYQPSEIKSSSILVCNYLYLVKYSHSRAQCDVLTKVILQITFTLQLRKKCTFNEQMSNKFCTNKIVMFNL